MIDRDREEIKRDSTPIPPGSNNGAPQSPHGFTPPAGKAVSL